MAGFREAAGRLVASDGNPVPAGWGGTARAGRSLCASHVAGALAPCSAQSQREENGSPAGRQGGQMCASSSNVPEPPWGPAHSPGVGEVRTAPSQKCQCRGPRRPSEQLRTPHSLKQDREQAGAAQPSRAGKAGGEPSWGPGMQAHGAPGCFQWVGRKRAKEALGALSKRSRAEPGVPPGTLTGCPDVQLRHSAAVLWAHQAEHSVSS